MKNTMIVGVGVFLILIAFIAGLFFQNPFKKIILRHDVLATVNDCPYTYINQLRCEPDTKERIIEYTTLRNDLISLIEEEKRKGTVSSISVYFRDLQNGPTISINAQENFIPASLLKVPLMIMYYQKAELDQHILKQKIIADGDTNSLSQNIIPEKTVIRGQEYTIDDLINLLITQSDNTAWKLLLNYMREHYSEEDFVETLSDLGVVDPRKRTDQQYITVQNYASIFRILYNSSYLSREMSDKALVLLTESSFDKGIEAGIPSGIQVAHKFGEQQNATTGEQQLHDCGIVYYPHNPYLLCVMTKGDSLSELESVIARLADDIHTEVVRKN